MQRVMFGSFWCGRAPRRPAGSPGPVEGLLGRYRELYWSSVAWPRAPWAATATRCARSARAG